MVDLIGTCPMGFWEEWIAEGDAAGLPESGEEWGWYTHHSLARLIRPGDRFYVAAWGRLRGYVPVTRLQENGNGGYVICRQGGAVACTIEKPIPGFRGMEKRWWSREDERPFPEWQTEGVGVKKPRAPVLNVTGLREHEWFTYGRLNWECCRVCGIVRRKDGKNSPCKGPVPVGPRGGAESGAGREVAWLIERQFSTDCGQLFETRWYAENDKGWHHWTTVALEAKRFASKAEAEAFPAYQMIAADPTISITEHVFVGVSHVC